VPAGIDVYTGITEENDSGFRVKNNGRVQVAILARGRARLQACPMSA
jgi:hypothetical protein